MLVCYNQNRWKYFSINYVTTDILFFGDVILFKYNKCKKKKRKGGEKMDAVLSIDEYKRKTDSSLKNPSLQKKAVKYSTQEINEIVELETNCSSVEDFDKKWKK